MATFVIRTFQVNIPLVPLENLREMFVDSINVFMSGILVPGLRSGETRFDKPDNFISCIYDSENDLIHPSFVGGANINNIKVWKVQELYQSKLFRIGRILVRTKKTFPMVSCLKEEELIDWGKTIDDLEKAGIVATKETESFFAENTKKFYFIDHTADDLGDGANSAVDIDFLGTKLSLADGTSERVLEAWREIR